MKSRLSGKTVVIFIFIWTAVQMYAQNSGSLNFNGEDNYVEVENSPLNTIDTGDFTIEAWVVGEESEQTLHPMIFSNRGSDPFAGGILFFFHGRWGGSHSKSLCFQANDLNYFLVDNGTLNASLLDSTCHHVAITRSGKILSFYADGILFGHRTLPNSVSVKFNRPLWIGQDRATNNTFNGLISHVRIWNIARTEKEILENKDIRLEGNEAGLIAYWEMNEGASQVVADKTGQFEGCLGSENGEDIQDPQWSLDGCIDSTAISCIETGTMDIYPNPSHSTVNIRFDCDIKNYSFLRIFNTLGQFIDDVNLIPGDTIYTWTPPPGFSGLYFMICESDGKVIQSAKGVHVRL